MRKVLILISELSYSGTPNSSLRLSRALLEAGYFVEVWSYKQGPFADEYKHWNVPIKIVSEKEFRNKVIINEILKFDFSICNSILTSEGYECISSLIPTYWYIREAENIPEFFMSNSRRGHLLKRCHNIITVSEYARDYIVRYFNIDVKVLHNCIDDNYEEYAVCREEQDNKVKIIIIGAIERRKNQLCMMDAYELLPNEIRTCIELHFVGRIPEWNMDYSKQFLERTKAVGAIYHGEIKDRREMMKLIAESDILAVISTDESCSLTALEGAMMAKPLILSKNVGAKYLLDENNGWLVNTDDSSMLACTLNDCYKNRYKLVDMGQISRKRYLATSTFDIYCKNVKDFFEKNSSHVPHFLYRLKNLGFYQIWAYDEFDKYYQYPEWGSIESDDKIYSFDIFDTLITRSVADPIGIFSVMQSMLQNNSEFVDIAEYVKNNFITLRIGAENLARTVYCINGTEDKTLNQIYEMLGKTGELDEEQLKKIKQLEIDTEIENTIPIKKNIDLVKQLVSAGKRVCLISDMYLPSAIIRQMLIKADPIFKEVKIYVSSECKKVKGSLGLFKYVQNKEKVSFKNWEHIGDNIYADYNAPLKLGITCEHYTGMEKNEIERKLLEFAQNDSYLQQILGLGNCLKAGNIEGDIINAYYLLKPFVDNLIDYVKNKHLKCIYYASTFGLLLNFMFEGLFNKYDISMQNVEWMKFFVPEDNGNLKLNVNRLKYVVSNNKLDEKVLVATPFILDKDKLNNNEFIDVHYNILQLLEDENTIKEIEHRAKELTCTLKNGVLVNFYNDEFLSGRFLDFIEKGGIKNYCSRSESATEDIAFISFSDPKKIKYIKKYFDKVFELIRDTGCSDLINLDIQPVRGKTGKSVESFCKKLVYHLINEKVVGVDDFKTPIDDYDVVSFCLQEVIVDYCTATREGLYYLIRDKLNNEYSSLGLSEIFINSFVDQRIETEHLVEQLYRQKKIPKKDIIALYNYLKMKWNFDDSQKDALIDIEIRVLKENIYLINENMDLIYNALSMGIKPVIIADSLYDRKFIKNVLISLDPIFNHVKIYSNASEDEWYFNSKEFFERVLCKVGVPKSNWIHISGNRIFDKNGVKNVGINAIPYKVELTTYEKNALLEFSDNLSAQLLIGAAKQSRNTYSGSKAQQIGSSLAGPMLYPYVNWVVKNAIRRKIEKLLFIARDGYILKKIADIIIETNKYNLKTEYVYGSRRAWRMPSYKSADSLDIFFRMAHLDQLADVESFSSIFNLSFDELAPYLPSRYNDRKQKLHGKDYDNLKDELEKNSSFKIYMEELAVTEANKVVDYFDEIIGNSTFAFVELSGSGITQNCLSKVLGERYEQVIITYFLNLYGAEDGDKTLFINYLPNKFYNGWIIENLCRAPHGQTEGYRRDGSHVKPILSKSEEAQALIAHGFYDYSYGCVQYTKVFEKNTKGMSNVKVDPVLFIKYLRHIVYNPAPEIKEFIGDMPFETTGFNDKLTVCAPVLTRQQIENIYVRKYSDERIDSFYDGASLDFSLKRLSEEDKEYVRYCESIVNTRQGQIERIKRRVKENGLISTSNFIKGRIIRRLLVKTGKIDYRGDNYDRT